MAFLIFEVEHPLYIIAEHSNCRFNYYNGVDFTPIEGYRLGEPIPNTAKIYHSLEDVFKDFDPFEKRNEELKEIRENNPEFDLSYYIFRITSIPDSEGRYWHLRR